VVTSRDELRAANRKKSLGTKLHDIKPSPIAIAMTNRKINVFACKVDVMRHCGDPQINLRMALRKPTESVYEPFGGKIR